MCQTSSLLDCIEASVETITVEYPNAIVILAGDFNSLDHAELSSRSMLTAIVNQSTQGTNILDQIFVSYTIYDAVKVVTPTVCSDHRAVIAYPALPTKQDSRTTNIQTLLADTACPILRVRTSCNL